MCSTSPRVGRNEATRSLHRRPKTRSASGRSWPCPRVFRSGGTVSWRWARNATDQEPAALNESKWLVYGASRGPSREPRRGGELSSLRRTSFPGSPVQFSPGWPGPAGAAGPKGESSLARVGTRRGCKGELVIDFNDNRDHQPKSNDVWVEVFAVVEAGLGAVLVSVAQVRAVAEVDPVEHVVEVVRLCLGQQRGSAHHPSPLNHRINCRTTGRREVVIACSLGAEQSDENEQLLCIREVDAMAKVDEDPSFDHRVDVRLLVVVEGCVSNLVT